jgi:peptidoglycan/LPS O-acetylase OafA/YrhL
MNKNNKTLAEVISSHENNFTLIRLILAIGVIYSHTFLMTKDIKLDYLSNFLMPITTVGSLSVQIFFFLSGLFVAQSFSKEPNLFVYFVRRILRIWPALIVVVILTTFVSIIIGSSNSVIEYLTFTDFYNNILKNIALIYDWTLPGVFENHRMSTINGAIHTLAPEVKMYVLLGIFGIFGLIKNKKVVFTIVLIFLFLCIDEGKFVNNFTFLFNMDYTIYVVSMFSAGVLAWTLSNYIIIKMWHGIVFILLFNFIDFDALKIGFFYCFIIWIVLYLGQINFSQRLYFRTDISYGIYLYGWPSTQFILVLNNEINPYLLTLLATILASFFAYFSWIIVEKPSIKSGKQFAQNLNDGKFLQSFKIFNQIPIVMIIFISFFFMMEYVTKQFDLKPVTLLESKIVSYGPQITKVNHPINKQPDGSSAIWIRVDSAIPKSSVVVLDNVRLSTTVGDDKIVTAKVPNKILSKVGNKNLFIEYRTLFEIKRTNIVILQIQN